jgi:RES domain-containing protein
MPQRWNGESQPTIYVSHEPEVAAAEKLAHLARSGTLGSARAFWSGGPATDEVFAVSFDPSVFRARLADLSALPDIGDFLTPNYEASQDMAAVLIANKMTAVRVPSAEFWPEVRLNEAYFVTLSGQPTAADFPPVTDHGVYKGAP